MDQEIQKLLDNANNIDINELTEEELKDISEQWHAIRRKTNPLASNIEDNSENEQLLFMFTPLYRDYLAKFVLTSVIGYINRACDEWLVPDGVPVTPVYDYIKDPSLIDSPESVDDKNAVDPELLKEYELNKKQMEKRIIVKEFIEYIFQYDPDEHIRSAYSHN